MKIFENTGVFIGEVNYIDFSGEKWRRTSNGRDYIFFKKIDGEEAYMLRGIIRRLSTDESIACAHQRFIDLLKNDEYRCDKSYDVV
jgi:hypothetical protein